MPIGSELVWKLNDADKSKVAKIYSRLEAANALNLLTSSDMNNSHAIRHEQLPATNDAVRDQVAFLATGLPLSSWRRGIEG